jgi:23S rRNA pseudouridine955/2504/2580 synthase
MIFKELLVRPAMFNAVQHLTVSEEEAGQRLDNYLLRCLKGAPRSLIYRVIRKGEVRVNKGRVRPDRKLEAGDVLRIPPMRLSEEKVPDAPGSSLIELLESSILLETADFFVVNKPAGLAVHGGSGINLGLIEALRQMWPQQKYLELVHRLDRETSGCILVAKKRAALKYLQSLFRGEKQVRKRYMALVKGKWPKHRSAIDVPLQRFELHTGERIVRVRQEGKASLTEFSIVDTFKPESINESLTLITAEPVSGRTHQIRVHAQHAGHPLAGDDKYGDDEFNMRMKTFGVKRLFLHAECLRFPNAEAEMLEVIAPLPDDLAFVLDKLKKG